MIKFARTLLITVLLFVPLLGICQIATPKWVDDIGGPSSNCISSAVKVDKQNNVYVTGFYDGTADFDPSAGTYNLTASGGGFDIFVAKYTSAGTLIWAKSFGGDGTDQVNSMTVDINGNPIISGQYNSTSINFGSSTIQNGGDWDAFVIKLNTNGGFVWAKSVGGSSTDYGAHVASDSQGNIVQCLRFESSFTLGGKNYSSTSGSFNALTIKYDPNGNVLWAINLPDASRSESIFSEFDSQNNSVVCGHFEGNDNFNPLGTAYNLNGNGNSTFVAKYSPSGILIWVKSFTGTVVGDNTNLCINSKDDIYVDGPFTSQMNFGTVTINPSGSQDIFLSKYSSAGVFQSANDVGGSGGGSIFNYGIVCSKDDYVYVSGYFSGTIDFDPSSTSKALVSDHGLQDFFLAKYDSNLNYKWAFNGGNNSCNQNLGRNVAIDNNNDVLYTGGFCSTVNFSASVCNPVIRTAQSGSRDCFLAKYTQSTATAQAEITSFSVPQQTQPATIDQTNLIITVTVPGGTNVKALVPTIVYTSGVTLTPASGAAQDFTDPVTYTLSTSCSSLNYTVNVVFAAGTTLQTTCSATSTTLTGAALTTTPTSYTWQVLQGATWVNAQGTINAKDYTATLTNTTALPVVYSYRRQVITGGTTTYDSRYDVTVIPAVANNTITAPPAASLCVSGDPGIIGGSIATGGTGTYVYQWQSSTDNVNFTNVNGATTQNYDPTLVTATTYYRRTVTSGACSTPLISNVVTVYILTTLATPVPTAATVSVCTGSGAGLSVSNPQAGVTYNWYDSATKTTLLHTGTNYTTGLLTSNTTYYIEATNGSCTSASMATVQVTVVALPAAPVLTANSVSACYGSTVTLTDNNPQGGHYNWYTVPTGGTAVASGVSFVTGAITQNTTYYVEDVNATGCISATRTKFDITVIPLPTAPQVQAPAPVCSGTASTLSIANPQAGLTYNWYATATGVTLLGTGTSYIQTDLTNNTYYAEAVNANSCTSATRTQVTVTPIDIPVAPQASSPAGICSGSTTILEVTEPQANVIYNWYDSLTGGTLLTSGNSYTTQPLAASTTYYIEAMSSIGGCTSTTRTAVHVDVIQAPPAITPPVSPPASVCLGSSTTLSISNPQTGVTYNWYNSAAKTNLLFTGISYTTQSINTNTAFYIEAVNGPCIPPATGSAQVSVIALPGAPAVVKSPVTTCSGTQATLSVASPQTNFTYNWYNTATGGTPVFTGTDFLTPQLTSSTTYYVEAVNSNSCTSSTRTAASVTVNPTPGITTGNISTCPGTSGTILASSSDPNVTISWYASPASTNALATGSSFKTPVLNNNAIYYAEAVDNTTGCISSSRSIATVTMYQQLAAPVVTVEGTTATTITFSWGAVDGASGYQVSVDDGVSFSTPSSGSSGLTNTVTGLKLGESVTIMVEATGVSTCQLSGSSTAVTGVAHDSVHDIIYVANAFTPNGDGVNDVVYVHSEDIRSMIFYVYDQWGEMLFKSTSQSVGWDGTYKGTKQPVGVYVYYLQAVMNDGQKITKKGTITLLK